MGGERRGSDCEDCNHLEKKSRKKDRGEAHLSRGNGIGGSNLRKGEGSFHQKRMANPTPKKIREKKKKKEG